MTGPGSVWHMSDTPDVPQVLAEVAELQSQLQRAYESGDAAAVDRLVSELAVVERRRNRAMQRSLPGPATTPGNRAALPVREQVGRVLGLLGRPTAVSMIRDVAAARFGDQIPGPRLASLRRDEHRSWRSAYRGQVADIPTARAGRPVYVVPALTYDRFAPVRGQLALSSWPLEQRLVAPASHRVDVLHAVDRLAGELATTPDASWAPDVERLLWRLAATVPGATDGSGPLDPEAVQSAAAAELSQLEEDDQRERAEAAERARSQLDEEQQLFGARLTTAPAGDGETAARAG